DCCSSITLISMIPTWGIFLPRIAATIALSPGSSPGAKFQTNSRNAGFASNVIFDAGTHDFSTYGPVPTGCAGTLPGYASTISCATATSDGSAMTLENV